MHDFLPRQARDKHRENSKKSGVPLAHVGFFDCVDDESVLIYENEHIFFGRHFVLKMYRFTKTGSGQTYGKHSERDLCVFPMFFRCWTTSFCAKRFASCKNDFCLSAVYASTITLPRQPRDEQSTQTRAVSVRT
jgi:hypothetical protein